MILEMHCPLCGAYNIFCNIGTPFEPNRALLPMGQYGVSHKEDHGCGTCGKVFVVKVTVETTTRPARKVPA
jgi:hypothetical protein